MAYGGILGQTSSGGKKVCRLVVGTSTSGWTAADCDYLCDGTADDVEINAAIQALPDTGGEIVILDGIYNITATLAMNKDNVKLSGNGTATILKRMWDSSAREGVITVTAANGGCCIENLCVDGNKATYKLNNTGIYLKNNSSNNTITGNTCNNNNDYGIYLSSSNSNNTITGNTCNNNDYGIRISYSSSSNTVTGNTCNDNNYGICLDYSSSSNTVTGNTCNDNRSYGISISSDNNTITGNTCNNNNDSGIYMSSSDNNTITGNTCNNNNDYGIYLSSSNDNNTITGNTCNDNNYGISLYSSDNNTVTGNTCIRGTGQASNYTTSQYTIWLNGASNRYNLIACNNIMGKNYVSEGGTGNSFADNKYN